MAWTSNVRGMNRTTAQHGTDEEKEEPLRVDGELFTEFVKKGRKTELFNDIQNNRINRFIKEIRRYKAREDMTEEESSDFKKFEEIWAQQRRDLLKLEINHYNNVRRLIPFAVTGLHSKPYKFDSLTMFDVAEEGLLMLQKKD